MTGHIIIQDPNSYSREEYEKVGQWENWNNLLDMANAVRYRFTRLPKPGMPIDIQEARTRIENIDKEWAEEHARRGGASNTSSPNFSGCAVEAQCYLYSILISNTDEEFPYLAY